MPAHCIVLVVAGHCTATEPGSDSDNQTAEDHLMTNTGPQPATGNFNKMLITRSDLNCLAGLRRRLRPWLQVFFHSDHES
jgi:hypothetical protein